MKIFVLLVFFFLLISFVHADLGTKWPTKEEVSKGPVWPSKYDGDPKNCKKVNEEQFIQNMVESGYKDEEEFTVETQVDYNLDGICEIVAYQRLYCGNKECGYEAFQLKNNIYIRNGQVYPDGFLEPMNGWLQLQGSGYTGNSYSLHLIRFENGSYRFIRSDRYVYDERQGKTQYIKSEYYK